MNLFFGKIKSTPDDRQINGNFYETLSPAKLGELQPGDYAFIISGQNVHLWKAKNRLELSGSSKMEFEVIHSNLPVSSKKFIAFKYFRLDSSLIVLTVRQSPKAFYPIHTLQNFTENLLLDKSTYKNEDNFRNITILPNEAMLETGSYNVQLYFKDGKLNLQHAPFFDPEMYLHFIDNLSKRGSGRLQKDKALLQIELGRINKIVYGYNEMSIMRMYDALFNDYGNSDVVIKEESISDSSEGFITSGEDSFELNSFNQIFYGPPGTGKTYGVIKSFCVEEETIFKAGQQRIKLAMNKSFWHLAPGRHGYLWSELKKGNVLGYEWSGKDWGDLKELTPKEVEDEDEGGSFQLISYFREVKKGDYICVISGKKFLGIAEVVESYNFETAKKNSFNFQTVPVKWLKQFDPPFLLNTSQTKTFVRLNNGQRWNSLLLILRENGFYFNDDEIIENKVTKPKNYTFITFHQSFSYEDFIQGIKPALPESDEEQPTSDLQYQLVPGIFFQACDKAAQLAGYNDLQDCLSDQKKNRQSKFKKEGVLEYYLIIDEFNRGNVASIFGELITLIEDDKRLGADNEIVLELPYSKTLFGVPFNLRIIGTMNTADRSIEALDTALRRRFSFEEVIANPLELPELQETLSVNLRTLLTSLNARLEKLLSRDHTIGHAFFLNVNNPESLKRVIANKIIPLLQEYFYGDPGKIGLVIGEKFLDISMNKTVFMKVAYYEATDLEEKPIYNLKNIGLMKDEDFLTAIKAIYE
ncbi:MAG: hypothetical protein JWR09_3585 [Mucilaginibacter sp.]|nr:hypothetical protein [Mucilaginibacter sp.]